MATYRKADSDTVGIIKDLVAEFYPELHEAGVKIGSRFAYAAVNESTGEPKGPALKHAGYPAAAIVRLVSQKDRVAGMPDAMIDLDGLAWEKDWNEQRKKAVLSHELHHLEVCRDEDGAIKLDDCNRPKLKLRPHDDQIGIFYEVVERFGEDAIEAEAYKGIHRKFTQMTFPWG